MALPQAQGAALRQAQDMPETNPNPHALENSIREILGHLAPLLAEGTDA